jgi:hypothetical protein
MANGKKDNRGEKSSKLTIRKRWQIKDGALMLVLFFTVSKPVNGHLHGTVYGQLVDVDIANGSGSCKIENVNPTEGKSQLEVTCDTDSDGQITLSEEVTIGQPVNAYSISLNITEYEVKNPDAPSTLRVLLNVLVTRPNGLPYGNLSGLSIACAGESKNVLINALGIGSADFGSVEYGKEYEVTFTTPDYGTWKSVIRLSIPRISFKADHELQAGADPTTFNVTVSTFDEVRHTNPVVLVTVQIGTECYQQYTQPNGRAEFIGLPLEPGKNATAYTVWVPGDVHENYVIKHQSSGSSQESSQPTHKSFLQCCKEAWRMFPWNRKAQEVSEHVEVV